MSIYKSVDAGLTFKQLIVDGPNPYWTASYDMYICESNPSIIYVSGEYDAGGYNYVPQIWRSLDGGATWSNNATGNLGSLAYAWATGIWVAPDDPNHVVTAGYGMGLWVTVDGGVNWTQTGPTCTDIVAAYHADQDILYAGLNGAGVWQSADKGLTWSDITDNLAGLNLYGLTLDPKNGWLFAAGGGTGVNRLAVTPMRLWAQYDELSETGGTVDFKLNAGMACAKKNYHLLGSLSGSAPGLSLPGGSVLPLNWDGFSEIVLYNANTPIFSGFAGVLDADGAGTATLDSLGPISPGLVGTKMTFAYLSDGVWPWYASNPVDVVIFP